MSKPNPATAIVYALEFLTDAITTMTIAGGQDEPSHPYHVALDSFGGDEIAIKVGDRLVIFRARVK